MTLRRKDFESFFFENQEDEGIPNRVIDLPRRDCQRHCSVYIPNEHLAEQLRIIQGSWMACTTTALAICVLGPC